LRSSILLGLGLVLMTAPACVSADEHREVVSANEALRRNLDDLARYQKELEDENHRLAGEVERLGKNAVEADFVRQQREELARLIEKFKQGGGGEIEGVKLISTPEGLAFQLQGEVLFNSGDVKLTTEGQSVLTKLAPTLQQQSRDLRVDGHTDSDPIRHSQWVTNMRLSAERAMAVRDFLTSQGLEPQRMHIAAFGPFRPAVAGTSEEAKRQNRRVEILMLRE